MVNIKIDEEELVDILVKRVKFWTEDEETIELYRAMYESYVDGGCFGGMELDIKEIVDNDCVNYCNVVYEGEEGFEDLLKVYEEQGLGDCSCEDCNANFIEAVNEDKTAFLIRW